MKFPIFEGDVKETIIYRQSWQLERNKAIGRLSALEEQMLSRLNPQGTDGYLYLTKAPTKENNKFILPITGLLIHEKTVIALEYSNLQRKFRDMYHYHLNVCLRDVIILETNTPQSYCKLKEEDVYFSSQNTSRPLILFSGEESRLKDMIVHISDTLSLITEEMLVAEYNSRCRPYKSQ
jgi:hypothetical protein